MILIFKIAGLAAEISEMLPISAPYPFQVRKLSMKNYEEFMNFITIHYFEDHEKSIFGDVKDMKKYNAVRVKMKLQQDWSLGIYDTTINTLVGVMMMTVEKKVLDPCAKSLDPCKHDFDKVGFRENLKLQQIDQFFATLEAGVFDMLQVDKLLYVGMVTIHVDYRKQGLLYLVSATATNMEWETACKYSVNCPTNEFACHSAKNLGFSVIREINYADYDSQNGTNLFANAKYPNIKAQLTYREIKPPRDVKIAKKQSSC